MTFTFNDATGVITESIYDRGRLDQSVQYLTDVLDDLENPTAVINIVNPAADKLTTSYQYDSSGPSDAV